MRDHRSCAHNLSSAKVKAWVKSFLFNTDIFILDNFLLARLKAVVSYFNYLFVYFNIIQKDKNTYQTKLEINVMITMELTKLTYSLCTCVMLRVTRWSPPHIFFRHVQQGKFVLARSRYSGFPSTRTNLSPFTKDFRGGERLNESID